MMQQCRRDAERAVAHLQGPEDIAALLDACLVDNAREPASIALLPGAVVEQADIHDVARGAIFPLKPCDVSWEGGASHVFPPSNGWCTRLACS